MTHSALDSFDPFATHPFTNGSGLTPAPPKPSQYPIPIPSTRIHRDYPTSESSSSPRGTSVSPQTSMSVTESPRPSHLQSSPSSSTGQPIFVPFRHETSSPDLVLKSPSKSYSFTDRYLARR